MGTQSHLLQSDLAQRVTGAKTFGDPAKLLVAGQRAKTHFLVKDRDLLTPAALTPAEGDHYLMPASGSIAGAWATAGLLNGEIAAYTNAAWLRITPATGDTVAIDDESGLSLRFNGSAWRKIGPQQIAETTGANSNTIDVAIELNPTGALVYIDGAPILPSQITSITPGTPAQGQTRVVFAFSVASTQTALFIG